MASLVFLLITCLGSSLVLGAVVDNITATENTWLDNPGKQSPCYVFAQIMAQCYGGDFEITDNGAHTGVAFLLPSSSSSLDNKCYCSTVQYQLISACLSLGGYPSVTWNTYVSECQQTAPTIGSLGFTVPAGIYVPAYAMIQTPMDFDLMLADQIDLDGIMFSDSTATYEVAVSGTLIGAVVTGASAGAHSTSWVTTQTMIVSTPTTHATSPTTSSASSPGSQAASTPSTSPSVGAMPITPLASSPGSDTVQTPSPTSSLPTSATLPPVTPNPAGDAAVASSSHTSLGPIIGGAVGGAALVLILLAVLLLCCRRHRRKEQYRVSLIPSPVTSQIGPEPAPWFSPAPSASVEPLMTQLDMERANTSRGTMYALGPESLPYASPSSRSAPTLTTAISSPLEKSEKYSSSVVGRPSVDKPQSALAEKWVASEHGYSVPEDWSPLPPPYQPQQYCQCQCGAHAGGSSSTPTNEAVGAFHQPQVGKDKGKP